MPRRADRHAGVLLALLIAATGLHAARRDAVQPASSPSNGTLGQLIGAIRAKAKVLEDTPEMRASFKAFTTATRIRPASVSYPDYVLVRVLYEATRDAGFWNLHWTITDREPNSDNIWRQWGAVRTPSPLTPTASAECDELSALYAFLAGRAGLKGVGLFWPFSNHTVAVWVVRPTDGPVVRVVVPTSQIFLGVTDSLDTRTFNPWTQKSIYEYGRRDVPDAFELPRPLSDFFLSQFDKYAGASEATLQQLRYLREGVFLKHSTPENAAREALKRRADLRSGPAEDLAAFQYFADDLRSASRD
jgi:hypothetical protein